MIMEHVLKALLLSHIYCFKLRCYLLIFITLGLYSILQTLEHSFRVNMYLVTIIFIVTVVGAKAKAHLTRGVLLHQNQAVRFVARGT